MATTELVLKESKARQKDGGTVTIKVCPVPGQSFGSAPPSFLRVRQRIDWWVEHAHDPEVLKLVSEGVGYN